MTEFDKILQTIAALFGFKFEEAHKQKSISLQLFGITKELMLTYNAKEMVGDSWVFDYLYAAQVQYLCGEVKEKIDFSKLFKGDDFEKIDKLTEILKSIQALSPTIDALKKQLAAQLLPIGMIGESFSTSTVLVAWQDVMGGYLKPYDYGDTEGRHGFGLLDPCQFQKSIYVVKDTESFFGMVKEYSMARRHVICLFPTFFESDDAQLGYFAFVFVRWGEIRLFTDRAFYGNPETLKRSRSRSRREDRRNERLYLPYEEIEAILKTTTLPSNGLGFIPIPIEKLEDETRGYLYFLAHFMHDQLVNMSNEPLSVLTTPQSSIKRLGAVMPTHFECVHEEQDLIMAEIMAAHFSENRLPTVVNNEVALVNMGMSLDTHERQQAIRDWWHYTGIAQSLNAKLRRFDSWSFSSCEEKKAFSNLLYTKADVILEKITSVKAESSIHFVKPVSDWGIHGDKNVSQKTHRFWHVLQGHEFGDFFFANMGRIAHIKDIQCIFSNRAYTATLMIHIWYFKELKWLLDTDLPPFFSAFRAHDIIPYSGNSILGLTNPLADVIDPVSSNYKNGITITLPINLGWWNKFSNGLPETQTIDFYTFK